MLSRMHFEMVAEAISKGWTEVSVNVESDAREATEVAIETVIDRLGDAFYADNPQFDRKRFEAACEPKAP